MRESLEVFAYGISDQIAQTIIPNIGASYIGAELIHIKYICDVNMRRGIRRNY